MMEWAPEGASRKRRRPTMTWHKTLEEDLAEMDVN